MAAQKPDDLRRCLHVYQSEVEGASRLYTMQMVDTETTYRQKKEEAERNLNSTLRQARESLMTNLRDSGLII